MNFSRLESLRHDEVIGFEQEQRIVEHEGGSFVDATALRLREALAYLGGLLLVGGGIALALDVSGDDIVTFERDSGWGGFLISLAVAAGLFAVAWVFGRSDPPGRRATGLLAALSLVAFGVAAGFFVLRIADGGDQSVLIIGLATTAAALPAWIWLHSAPTQIVLHVAIWIVVIGILIVVGIGDEGLLFFDVSDVAEVGGLLFLFLGLAWLALVHIGYMRPPVIGYVLGVFAAWTGTEILVNDASGWLILQLALGGGLLVYGSSIGRSVLLALGSLVLAEGVARLLTELIDDVTYGAMAALALGAAAVLLAVSMQDRAVWRAVRPPSVAEVTPEETAG